MFSMKYKVKPGPTVMNEFSNYRVAKYPRRRPSWLRLPLVLWTIASSASSHTHLKRKNGPLLPRTKQKVNTITDLLYNFIFLNTCLIINKKQIYKRLDIITLKKELRAKLLVLIEVNISVIVTITLEYFYNIFMFFSKHFFPMLRWISFVLVCQTI